MSLPQCKAKYDIMVGHKIKLFPTESQKKRIFYIMNICRGIYNWVLGIENDAFERGEKFINYYDIGKIFTQYRNDPQYEWMKTIPHNTAKRVIRNAIFNYKLFFEKVCSKPRFKKKKDNFQSFPIRSERMYFSGDYVRFEGLESPGEKVLCNSSKIPFPSCRDTKYYKAAITYDGIDFWLSFSIPYTLPISYEPNGEIIGVDIGLRKLAVLSNGTEYVMPNIKKLLKRETRLKRRVQTYNSKIKKSLLDEGYDIKEAKTKLEQIKSKNQIKREKTLRKIAIRMKNIRHTFVHNMTTEIVNLYPKAIVLEDLKVKELKKKRRKLSKLIDDSSLRMIRDLIEYKAIPRGIEVVIANRWYPSTQICSNCGCKHNPGRSEIYKCPFCGFSIDRDLNAAINLRNYYAT